MEYAVHVRKAKKFAEALNRYFAEKIWTTIACWTNQPAASMRYFLHNIRQCCLHRRLKQDSGSIKKEVQNETVKKYYLEYMEYNSAQIEKVTEFLSE